MPRATGLTNPDNAQKSAGQFKEGLVRIDSNSYKVHKPKDPTTGEPPIPATKWSWMVTRLDENQQPVVDEHDEPVTEELLFSFGTKSLPFCHPGQATSPDDDEPEDAGTEVEAEGNTIYLVAADWKPNEKSSIIMLTRSMTKNMVKSDYINRCWTPDWNGCVFELKSVEGGKGNDGRTFNYKVVTRVLQGPGSSSGAKKGGSAASSNGKPDNAEAVLAPILNSLSENLDGQALTRKAFQNRVREALEAKKVDSKLMVPVLSLCKDDKWLQDHGDTFDFFVDPIANTITFGKLPAV